MNQHLFHLIYCSKKRMRLLRQIGTFVCTALYFMSVAGQEGTHMNRQKYQVHVNRTNAKISIDGILDEPVWSMAEQATHLQRVLPTDTGFAAAQTKVMLTYDKDNLYMGIICYDSLPGKRPVESLRRDFTFGKNDNFLVFIDTYNDYTNGFSFGVTASGAQWDGIQANGGFVSLDWDTKWKSAVKNYPDRWTAEFAIPFRSIRYTGGSTVWGINFSRLDLKTNEKSSWAPMPRQFQTANLAYTGSLIWDKPLPSSGPRFSLIPYVLAKATHDASLPGSKLSYAAGMDAKLMLSTSLNLDLTLHPDFSQVEVDNQMINLDRYELFYPEKRQFFLENSDLFASLGVDNVRPFFSRRIGLDNPVLGGARLSGKIGNDWRIGLMDMQTGTGNGVLAGNYSVAAVQKKVFSRSNITAFLVNKIITAGSGDSASAEQKNNRVAGLEYNLASADNKWTGKAFYHQALYSGSGGAAFASAADVAYQTQKVSLALNQSFVGKDYQADVGYIRRKGYYEFNPSAGYKFFPSGSYFANHGPLARADFFFDPSGKPTDRYLVFDYNAEANDRSLFTAELTNNYVRLLAPFDPTNTGGDSLASGTSYHWNEAALSYTSDTRKLFNFLISTRYGGYYNGSRWNVYGELYYRVQPYSNLAIIASYNRIMLPAPYNSASLILLGPKLDITFTNKLFLTTFVQYNNQIDNFNVNVRFQWRYAPASDLFIVYTDNSDPEHFRNKNRGLIVKLSYWFN